MRGNDLLPEIALAASLIVLKRDAVCLVYRDSPPMAGLWSFPGGRLEPGESPADAARRELAEETGLSVGPLLPLGDFDPTGEGAIELNVFAAHWQSGEPVAASDAADAQFCPLQVLADVPLTPRARLACQCHHRAMPGSAALTR